MDLSVVIIEDHPNYRHSLETLFKYAEGFYLATSFGSAQAAVYEVERQWRDGTSPRWDLVLMDIDLP